MLVADQSNHRATQMDATYLQERITATKAAITAYEDAQLALAGGALSYSIDTGQTKQMATQKDVAKIHTIIDSLYNRLATLEARANGSGGRIVRMI